MFGKIVAILLIPMIILLVIAGSIGEGIGWIIERVK